LEASENLVEESLQQNSAHGRAEEAWNNEYHILLKSKMADYVERGLSAQLDQIAALADPPSNNMGGNLHSPPPIFSHDEKLAVSIAQKTTIDWLAFTCIIDIPAITAVVNTIWPNALLIRNKKGLAGYPESYSIHIENVQYGVVGCGASHGRNYVSLTGVACKTLTHELIAILVDILSLKELDARLTRLDLCLDLFHGELTWDHAYRSYDNGAFKGRKGGRNPQRKVIDLSSDGQNLGRTLYLGRRDGAVYGRVYEKGLEVFARLPDALRELSYEREEALGSPSPQADSWLRLEVEYKRVENDLSFDMLLNRDVYFAGAYPYFADALGLTDGVRPKSMKTDEDVSLIRLMHNARRSYGSLIHSLVQLGFTPNDVVEHLSSGSDNQRLLRSGLLDNLRAAVQRARDADPDAHIPF
jgi:phage replication initiation protein